MEEDDIEKNVGHYDRESDPNRWGSGEVIMKDVSIYDGKGKRRKIFSCNDGCRIEIKYKAEKRIEDAVIGVAIYRSDQTFIYGTNSLIDTAEPVVMEGEQSITMEIKSIPLNEGLYMMDFAFHRPDGFNYDFWRDAIRIEIENPHQETGIISLDHKWIS